MMIERALVKKCIVKFVAHLKGVLQMSWPYLSNIILRARDISFSPSFALS